MRCRRSGGRLPECGKSVSRRCVPVQLPHLWLIRRWTVKEIENDAYRIDVLKIDVKNPLASAVHLPHMRSRLRLAVRPAKNARPRPKIPFFS